jgi:polyisoprenoid-binding protein YceI
MKKLLLIYLVGWPMVVTAQVIKPDQAIQFSIKNAGIAVVGSLSDWEVEVNFDPKKLDKSTIKGVAFPKSIETGISLRDRHLQGRQYFNSEKYPQITLSSTSFQAKGKGAFVGIFEVQIKETRKSMEVHFTVSGTGQNRRYSGEFTLNRLDFGIGEKSLILSEEVHVKVSF